MDSWIFAAKLLLLGHVALTYTLEGGAQPLSLVITVLASVSTAAFRLLARGRSLRLAASVLSALAAGLAAVFVDRGFLHLVPLSLAEGIADVARRPALTVVPAMVLALLVEPARLPAYVLGVSLSLAVFLVARRADTTAAALRATVSRLTGALETLRERTARGEEGEERLTRLAQLEERSRLTAAVHDRLGHAVSGTTLQLEAALAVLDRDPGSARTMVGAGLSALREGMDGIRAALRGLRPGREELGIERIRSMADRFAGSSGLRAVVNHQGDLGLLRPDQWRVFADNLRECLTNTARHGKARVVHIDVSVLHRIATVQVRDDGLGADPVRPGIGVAGMEERTESLGGKLVVDGRRGFSVTTILPLGEDRAG